MTKYYLIKSKLPHEYYVNTPKYLERVDNNFGIGHSYEHMAHNFPPASESRDEAIHDKYMPSTQYSDFLFTKEQVHFLLDFLPFPKVAIKKIKPASYIKCHLYSMMKHVMSYPV